MIRQRHARWHPAGRLPAGWLLCALLGSLPTTALAQAVTASAPRIAYVDMQRLLDNAPQTLATRDRLAREFATRDEALKLQSSRLQQMETRRADHGGALNADEVAGLDQEIATLRRTIERTRARMSEELARRTREESDQVWPQINEAVARYAREHGLDLVVPSPVLYASAEIDITERVLDMLRADQAPQP